MSFFLYLLATMAFMFIAINIVITYKKTILKRNGKPYLIRWTIFKTIHYSIKIHKLLMSDPADMHDHPWNYTAIILYGGYIDHSNTSKHYKPGSIITRKAHVPHYLELPEGQKCSYSLIITSRKYRDWGIHTNQGWIDSRQRPLYSKLSEPIMESSDYGIDGF